MIINSVFIVVFHSNCCHGLKLTWLELKTMTHLRLTQEAVHVLEGLFTIGVCCLCNLHNVQLDQDNFSLDLFVNLHLFGKSISPCQGSLPHLTCQFHNTTAISLQTCFCFLSLNIVVVDGGRSGQNERRVLT